MRGVLLLFVLFPLLSSVGCAADAPLPATDKWQLEYRLSGGILGLSIKITLDHTGRFRRLDERSYKLIERKLLPKQLTPIHDAVQALAAAEPPIPPAKTICNDCFRYDLTLTSNGKTRQYHHLSGMDSTETLLKLLETLQPLTGV